MKKRTAFIGAILSLMPFGQSFLIKTNVVLPTAGLILSIPQKAIAESAEFYKNSGNDKLDNEDYKGAISDFTEAIKINPKDCLLYTSPSPRDSCASRMPSSA